MKRALTDGTTSISLGKWFHIEQCGIRLIASYFYALSEEQHSIPMFLYMKFNSISTILIKSRCNCNRSSNCDNKCTWESELSDKNRNVMSSLRAQSSLFIIDENKEAEFHLFYVQNSTISSIVHSLIKLLKYFCFVRRSIHNFITSCQRKTDDNISLFVCFIYFFILFFRWAHKIYRIYVIQILWPLCWKGERNIDQLERTHTKQNFSNDFHK